MSYLQEYLEEIDAENIRAEHESHQIEEDFEFDYESGRWDEEEMTKERAITILSYCDSLETAFAACPDDCATNRWRAICRRFWAETFVSTVW